MHAYAYGRLAAALESAATHADPAVRTRAGGKVARWRAVLDGMAGGELTVGSRTPVADTPAWVTLEVLHGGFATGAYLADQPLTAAERAWLPPDQPGSTDRERLNLWFLGDAGQAELLAALAADRYRVELPEHAALAVVAVLLDRGRPEAALDLVTTLRPLLHRLRFTPTLLPRPEPASSTVHLEPAGTVADTLRAVRNRPQLAAMRATLGVWNPLHDQLVALWAETVDGPPPRLVGGEVVGGWPARRYPDGWADRRQAWLDAVAAAGPVTGRHAHPRGNFARLRRALEAETLTGRDVGWVRRALANTLTRAGGVDRTALRAEQAAVAAAPTHADLAHLVAARLDRYPRDEGVPALEEVVAPLPVAALAAAAGTEAPETAAGPAVAIPDGVVRTARRALEAPVAELVRLRVIPSGEVLARVLPQLTARHAAAGIADPLAAGLYARTYASFRRRRSLLLLDLQSQVTLEELPWAAALEGFRVRLPGDAAAARDALRETVLLALTGFPATVLPNPLVTEIGALARRAGLRLPLVEDVAADIFTGTFTPTWRAAAEVASRTLAGSPYARYYDLPESWAAPPVPVPRRRPFWPRRTPPTRPTAADFAARCRDRAAAEAGGRCRTHRGSAAGNGTVLEQAAILTTANLAVLTDALDLGPQLGDLAERTLGWAARQVERLPVDRHGRLLAVKNAAYGWRQGIFFLGFADPVEQAGIVDRLAEATAGGPAAPAVAGLRQVLRGDRFGPDGSTPAGGRRLLGWTTGRHWLLLG